LYICRYLVLNLTYAQVHQQVNTDSDASTFADARWELD